MHAYTNTDERKDDANERLFAADTPTAEERAAATGICMYMYMYMYMHVHTHTYMYIYMYT